MSDHALAMHLGLLQVTIVSIGIGMAALSFLGFNALKDVAKDAAMEKAEETAVPIATKTAELIVLNMLGMDTEEGLSDHDLNNMS